MKKLWVIGVVSIMVFGGLFTLFDTGRDFSVDKAEEKTEIDNGIEKTRSETWDYVHEMDTWDDSHHPSGWSTGQYKNVNYISHSTSQGQDGHALYHNEQNTNDDCALEKVNLDMGAAYTIEVRVKVSAGAISAARYYDGTYMTNIGVGVGSYGIDTSQWHVYRRVTENGYGHFYIDGELYSEAALGTYSTTIDVQHHDFWFSYTALSGTATAYIDYVQWADEALHPNPSGWEYEDEFNSWSDDHHPSGWATGEYKNANYITHSTTAGLDNHAIYHNEQNIGDDCALEKTGINLGATYTIETRAKANPSSGCRYRPFLFHDGTYSANLALSTSSYSFDITQWHVYRMVADNGYNYLYVDGVLYSEGTMGQYTPDIDHEHYDFWISWTEVSHTAEGWMDYIMWTTGEVHPSQPGPVAYWPMDENTGTTTYDQSGNGNNGTINGATWTTGINGSALSFDGTDDYINLDAHKSDSEFDTDVGAVEMWINPASDGNNGHIFTFRKYDISQYIRFLEVGDTQLRFLGEIGDSFQFSLYTPTDSLVPGEWNHMVFQQTGSGIEVYINGEKQTLSGTGESSTMWFADTFPASYDFRIAHWGSWSTKYKGLLDEISIYDYALDATTIQQHYDQFANPVNNPPVLDVFTVPSTPTVYEGEGVDFDATGSYDPDGDAITIEWDFDGDGSFDATGATTSHVYPSAGSYDAKVKISDGNASVNLTITVTVRVNKDPVLVVETEPSPPEVYEDATVHFDASESYDPYGDAITIEWDLDGDSTVDDDGTTASYQYPTAGDYRVHVTANDGVNTVDTYIDVTVLVKPENDPPVLLLSTSPSPPVIYAGESVSLDASDSYDPDGDALNLSWDLDGDDIPDAFGLSVEHTYDIPGDYPVTATLTDGIDSVSKGVNVTVLEKPVAAPSVTILSPQSDLEYYVGEQVCYEVQVTDMDKDVDGVEFSFGDGTAFTLPLTFGDGNSTTARYNYSYDSPGSYFFMARAVDSKGHSATDSLTLSVLVNDTGAEEYYLNILSPSSGKKFELDEEITFKCRLKNSTGSVIQADAVTWYFGDGSSGEGQEVTHSYSAEGTYTATVLAEIADLLLERNVTLVISTSQPTETGVMIYSPDDGATFEIGERITFRAMAWDERDNDLLNIYWDFGPGPLHEGRDVEYTYSGVGTYEVYAFIFHNGSEYRDSISIEIVEQSSPMGEVRIVSPESGTYWAVDSPIGFEGLGFDDQGRALKLKWDFGDDNYDDENVTTTTHTYLEPGNYSVTLVGIPTEVGYDFSDSDMVWIYVLDEETYQNVHNVSNHRPIAVANYQLSNLTVQFDGSGSFDIDNDPLTYVWDFGDGSSGSGVVSEHVYGEGGAYVATLYVYDDEGEWNSVPVVVFLSEEDPSPEEYLKMKKKIGATVNLGSSPQQSNSTTYYTGLNIEVVSMNTHGINISVEAAFHEGKVIVVNLDSRTPFKFNKFEDKMTVRINGTEVALSSVDTILEAEGDLPLYCVTVGTKGVQILIYFPHFSQYFVTLEKESDGGGGEETEPEPESDPGFDFMPFVLILVVIIIAIALVLGFMRYRGGDVLDTDPLGGGPESWGRRQEMDELLEGMDPDEVKDIFDEVSRNK